MRFRGRVAPARKQCMNKLGRSKRATHPHSSDLMCCAGCHWYSRDLMQPVLHHISHFRAPKPDIFPHRHAAQLKTKLDRPKRVPNVKKPDTKAAMAADQDSRTTDQHCLYPIIQQLQRFIQKDPFIRNTGKSHREARSKCLWHGITLQEPAGTSADQTFQATTLACSALSVPSTEKLQVVRCLFLHRYLLARRYTFFFLKAADLIMYLTTNYAAGCPELPAASRDGV